MSKESPEDMAELREHPVLRTTRITLDGETPEEQAEQFDDGLRAAVRDNRSALCSCGAECEDKPNVAYCAECEDTFVPRICSTCGRRAELIPVDDTELCSECAERWTDEASDSGGEA